MYQVFKYMSKRPFSNNCSFQICHLIWGVLYLTKSQILPYWDFWAFPKSDLMFLFQQLLTDSEHTECIFTLIHSSLSPSSLWCMWSIPIAMGISNDRKCFASFQSIPQYYCNRFILVLMLMKRGERNFFNTVFFPLNLLFPLPLSLFFLSQV